MDVWYLIRLDKIRNECTRRSLRVTNISGKIRENKWDGLDPLKKINNDEIAVKGDEIKIEKNRIEAKGWESKL